MNVKEYKQLASMYFPGANFELIPNMSGPEVLKKIAELLFVYGPHSDGDALVDATRSRLLKLYKGENPFG